ncbi:hypothetical protein [Pseudomonas sp. AA-38]|uniref:hypothetical protein n=1 Tax=Pseudomonas sp. AA-38 TaxID=3028807 RepID=UPI0023F7DAF0|nr:hypothetical protein [Pseudomonas sp. AA-38]
MSNNVCALSKGAACEAGKLIVQVVGKDHPTTQKLVICDENNAPLTSLTQQDKPEIQTSDSFSSVLHVWDWEGQPKRTLCLEIAASEGGAIRLPLHDELRTTPRQPEHGIQWNQIVPVVPMTALPGSKSSYDLGTPVSLRNGYLYLFYRGKLWRELEVRNSESGVTYHDVRVASYRQGKGFKSGPRKAVGVALEEIWLPSQWNNRKELGVQLCFSEIQLSAARLAFLEQDTATRRTRTQQRQLDVSKATFDKLFKGKPGGLEIIEAYKQIMNSAQSLNEARLVRMNLDLWAFPLSIAAPQRGRQAGYELTLDNPSRYLCDLSGQYPAKSLAAANAFLDACQAGKTTPAEPDVEMGAIEQALREKLKAQKPRSEPTFEARALWQAQPGAADIFAALRPRQLCAILLDDNQFRLRHLTAKIASHKMLLEQCAEYARSHGHFASAMLVQQTIVPRSVSGEVNKLHACISKITPTGLQDLNRFTATIERMEAWQAMESSQQCLVDLLEKSACQQTLADHLSLDHFDYTAALHFAAQAFSSLATTAADHDPLASNSPQLVDAVDGRLCMSQPDSAGRRFILEVAENVQHPLHRMFWPKYDLARLEQAYVKPDQVEENIGDGAFRATVLAAQEGQQAPREAQTTIDAAQLQGLLDAGGLASAVIVESKTIANGLISIYEHLDGAINAASKGIDKAKAERAAANQQRQQAQSQHDSARREHEKATEHRQQAEKAQQTAESGQRTAKAELDKRRQALSEAQALENVTRRKLAAEARPMNIRLHGMSIAQLRSMLTKHFGELRLMRRSAANAGGYYIFALSDLPLEIQRTIRAYGEVLDGQGKLIASSNTRTASRQGLPSETADHMVAAMPENQKTARLIKALNRHKNARMMAEQAESIASQINAEKNAVVHAMAQQTTAARRQEAAWESRMKQAQELAQTAQKEIQLADQRIQELARSVDAGQRNLYFQTLNSGAFSMAVLSLEMWNLFAEWGAQESNIQQKGMFRARIGFIGATLDLAIAFEVLAFKIKDANRFSTVMRATLWEVNKGKAMGILGEKLGSMFVVEITARLLATAVASFVMMVVCIMDAIHAWQWGDDAVWGFGAMALGAMLGGIAPFFSGSSVLFGFNPFSLAALVLIVLGAGLVFWLSSTQLEDWLECGPFGAEPRDYLANDAQEAFYRLVGIFAGIRIAIEPNPYFNPNTKLDRNQEPGVYRLASANTRIRISSNLPGLLAQMGDISIYPETRLRSSEVRYRGNGDPYPATVTVHNPDPVAQRILPDSLELYMNTPLARRWTGSLGDSSLHHEWQVRAQLRLALDSGEKDCRPGALLWLFPAPPIRSGKADPSQAAAANFNKTNEPFWADEKTHAES